MISVQMFSNSDLRFDVTHGFITMDEKTLTTETATEFFTTYPWSPHVWSSGVRVGKNWVSCNTLALDFDNGKMTLGQAFDEFGDYWHIIGTTKSHMVSKNGEEPCHRFRVLLMLPTQITNSEYCESVYKTFTNLYPCDTGCKDLGRWFLPCKTIESTHLFEKEFNPKPFPIPKIIEKTRKIEPSQKSFTPGIPTKGMQDFAFEGANDVGTRHDTILRVARECAFTGMSFDETFNFITSRTNKLEDNPKDVFRTIEEAYKWGSDRSDVGKVKPNNTYIPLLMREGIKARQAWSKRQQTIYVANYFVECGLSFEETLARVSGLIKDWNDFTHSEVYNAVKSAYKSAIAQ